MCGRRRWSGKLFVMFYKLRRASVFNGFCGLPRLNREKEIAHGKEITYRDSVTGKPLFIAPRGRSVKKFIEESDAHGWPSFRDEEVVWDNVRVLKGASFECCRCFGEVVSENVLVLKNNGSPMNYVTITRESAQNATRYAVREAGGYRARG